jgi:hypothetical protein
MAGAPGRGLPGSHRRSRRDPRQPQKLALSNLNWQEQPQAAAENGQAGHCYQHWNVSEGGYGYCLAAMARAWIRTGRHRMDPVNDSAYYEDLAGRLYGLVIAFSGRLPADQAQVSNFPLALGILGAG